VNVTDDGWCCSGVECDGVQVNTSGAGRENRRSVVPRCGICVKAVNRR
jgi:hypothetical protein